MRGTVLIVHDDAEVRGWLGDFLGGKGFRVLAASTGQEALGVLEEDLPALLVIGVGMPLLSGWKLVEALAHYPDLARIPRLLIGSDEPRATVREMALALLEKGADEVQTTPPEAAPRAAANA